MRLVVMGCDGAGSRSHYITGYHGPGYIMDRIGRTACI